MIIRNFYETQLAQASYLIGCAATGEAIVIDPVRDVRRYLDAAEALGLRIVAATETHIHADFLSGTRELAATTGAAMYLSAAGGEAWQYAFADDPNVALLQDGSRILIGNVSLRAMHTPGHTPEHLAFLLTDHAVSALPHSLFSGDLVFVGDVGRPDLLERAANVAGTRESCARELYRSLKKLQGLPDSLLIWPGHGAGSACGKALGGSPATTLGYERATNWAFLAADEDRFVGEILCGQPEPPPYFKEMKRLNQRGPAVLQGWIAPPRLAAPSGQLVDVRAASVIRERAYDDALALPQGKSFTGWAGWTVGYDDPITLIADDPQQANAAARDLAAIGLDAVAGWVHPMDLDPGHATPVLEIRGAEILPDDVVLDVRESRERSLAQVVGSRHIPYGQLASRLGELPRDRRIVVYCASGNRSLIACSILRRAGFRNVSELKNGIAALEAEMPELVALSGPAH